MHITDTMLYGKEGMPSPTPKELEDGKQLLERTLREQTKTIYEVSKLPEELHYAVLVNESFTYDDGYGTHGRPSISTAKHLQYIAFTTQVALEAWIEKNSKLSFRVIQSQPLKVQTKIVVSFGL